MRDGWCLVWWSMDAQIDAPELLGCAVICERGEAERIRREWEAMGVFYLVSGPPTTGGGGDYQYVRIEGVRRLIVAGLDADLTRHQDGALVQRGNGHGEAEARQR